MSSSIASGAHPLDTLTRLTTTFEAAILECLAKPRKRSVHHLRTSARRIEAQLELLTLLPNLPPHRKPISKALKLLGKIRQAAGKVRDCDVQCELTQKATSRKDALRGEALKLRRALKQKRNAEADVLVELLRKHKSKLPLTMAKLLDSFASAKLLTVTESGLIALVQTWYAKNVPALPPPSTQHNNATTARLHDIRKKAKLARYLAESAPKSATKARRLAAKFEDLQQAGGEWHDWLLLADIASDQLGKSSKLAAHLYNNSEKSLRAYQHKLSRKILATRCSGSDHGLSRSTQPAAARTPDRRQSPSRFL